MQRLKPIMLVGTGSDVGKSVLAAGLCRIFKQDGYCPAPFKGQNMSLNSYVTAEGLEMGRAQVVQAEAAGVPCHTDMNPVLLKPTSDQASQVIVNGKAIGQQSAHDYFKENDRSALLDTVKQAFDRLKVSYSPIVMEGAGSISELNLKHRDITNMRMAIHAGAATYLVADIDKGGVFGSVYGTIALLTPEERACMKGIIINKFRGDARLFIDGRRILEDLTGLPVVGVIPYFSNIYIEQEDSVALESKFRKAAEGRVNVAVVRLRRLSNFTDFDRLESDPRVNLYYSNEPSELARAAVILIPGSKNTLADMLDLRNNGAARAIVQAHKAGTTVVGICGGYQMMGETIADPLGVEGDIESIPGLGLLPIQTTLLPEKTTRQRAFTFREFPEPCEGYEIHMGQTVFTAPPSPVAIMDDQSMDGYWLNNNTWGTYLHGILDNDRVINYLLAPYANATSAKDLSFSEFKSAQFDRLAEIMRENLDIKTIYQTLKF
ncbi:cobyric acid synthase [Dyadobacter tibetensis]|uniref:cobyric acid synthase n=1 Tax=Dyadobacter tibetensis TaxID=1211851 RepID=UPI00047183FC|nr:cobyric acid synthase [Dyadobacter tibetensis]